MFWQSWFNIDPNNVLRSLVFDIWPNLAASAIIGVLAYFLILKKILVCEKQWCFRIGHHRVAGTHYRTCNKHATPEYHTELQHRHYAKYPRQHEFLSGKEK